VDPNFNNHVHEKWSSYGQQNILEKVFFLTKISWKKLEMCILGLLDWNRNYFQHTSTNSKKIG